jgi:glycine cleavage system regulatory protein
MAGGVLFEARIAARVPDGVETTAVVEELERLAAEIQVDVALDD